MPKNTDLDLEKKLQEEQQKNQKKSDNKGIKKLEERISQLEKENQEISETCKRAQYDYINLKSDMDLLQRRTSEKEKNMELDKLLDTVKKFLPFVEELRKSIENIAEENKESPLAKGVELTYNKFLKTLETMNIFPIESIGLEPDSLLHEPVSAMPTEDKKIKGKIIQEFERGFIYKKDGQTQVITTSKVVIAQ